ncbi:MAG TPA: pitrilysin family protein [Bacteroidia bacterium]|nr:pitrilysin family protein [Bacteroidia bacterium]
MKAKYIILFLIAGFLSHSSLAQKLVELPIENSSKVVIKLMFRNGSICDPSGKEGLTYLTSELIADGGTRGLSSSQIKEMLYPTAATYYSTCDKEVSIFTLEVHKDHLKIVYPLFKDLILSPAFSEEDFKRVKSNQLNYVDEVVKSSSDEEYSKKALEYYLYKDSPYQHLKQGSSAGVQSITLDDVKKHHSQFFTSVNLVIGIAGSYSKEFATSVAADFSMLSKETPRVPTVSNPPMPRGINVNIISKKGAFGSAIYTGYPIDINRSREDFAALMIANSWMGEHRKSYSRLYQKIREARSMNYGDYTYIEWYENGGSNMLPVAGVPRSTNSFSIWIRPVQIAKGLKAQYEELKNIEVGHAHFALRMAIREIDQLVYNGMTNEDFELTRTFLQSYTKLYAQSPGKRLGFLMDSKFYGRADYLSELDANLSKVTLTDVNQAIRKYFQTSNMEVVIVTDESEAEPLKKSLENNTVSPMSYNNSLKSVLTNEILEEDKQVENYKLNISKVSIINSDSMFK